MATVETSTPISQHIFYGVNETNDSRGNLVDLLDRAQPHEKWLKNEIIMRPSLSMILGNNSIGRNFCAPKKEEEW